MCSHAILKMILPSARKMYHPKQAVSNKTTLSYTLPD